MVTAFAEKTSITMKCLAENLMIILCSAVSFATQKSAVPSLSLPRRFAVRIIQVFSGIYLKLGRAEPLSYLDSAQKSAISLPPTHRDAFGKQQNLVVFAGSERIQTV